MCIYHTCIIFGDRTLVVLPMLLIGPEGVVYVEKQNCVLMVGTADASLEPRGRAYGKHQPTPTSIVFMSIVHSGLDVLRCDVAMMMVV